MTRASLLKRLRAARLRPSAARIGVLQVIEAASPKRVSAEEVYWAMMQRGTRASLGTIYRALIQCREAGLMLRELDERTWRYGLRPVGVDAPPVELVCPVSGRVVLLADKALYERLLAAARGQGIALEGRAISIQANAWREKSTAGAPKPRDEQA